MVDTAKDAKKAAANVRYAYPSHFGSHASMIDEEETDKLVEKDCVILRDEFGLYMTEKWRLDCGLADPNRYKGRCKLVAD